MLEAARRLDAEVGAQVEYRVAKAEDTGLPEGSADVVSAGQCWHWFDRPRAAREVARLLRGRGRLLIAHFDWIPLSNNVARATEALIESHNPDWKLGGGLGIHPWWLRDLCEAGFREPETFSYDMEVPYTPTGWRGRVRASAGVAGTMNPQQVERFDRALGDLLASDFPGDLLYVLHRIFAVLAKPPERAA